MREVLFAVEPFDSGRQCRIDVSDATKIFCMVLDYGVSDVRRYWEHICFIAKYDIPEKLVEICDINSGVREFHRLLQQSSDLHYV